MSKDEVIAAMRKELEVAKDYKSMYALQSWLRCADILSKEQLEEKLIEIQEQT